MTDRPTRFRDDGRLYAPAALRNRAALLTAAQRYLPAARHLLEFASGTGEHAIALAAALPGLIIQPSDPDKAARTSITAWTLATGVAGVRPPLDLDAGQPPWPVAAPDSVLAVNLLHLVDDQLAERLIAGIGATTSVERALLVAPLSTDRIERLTHLAASVGFTAPTLEAMPDDGVLLVFCRAADQVKSS